MNLSLISSYFFPLFQISFFSWRSVWFVLSNFWILLSGWDSFPCELALKAKPAWFVFSWAADGAGGAELREREESSGEGIWWQKGGTEGKLNCGAGGEEEDDWKWEINNGADGRWEPELERTSLSPVWNHFNLGCFFFSLKHRFNGGETHNDPEAEEAPQWSSANTRQTEKTCTRYPLQKTFVPHKWLLIEMIYWV